MNIKFEVIRIGKTRKNKTSEIWIQQNLKFLKENILHVFNENKINISINLLLIIPSRGNKIRISLRNINNSELKYIIKENFSDSIYNGNYNLILKNINK